MGLWWGQAGWLAGLACWRAGKSGWWAEFWRLQCLSSAYPSGTAVERGRSSVSTREQSGEGGRGNDREHDTMAGIDGRRRTQRRSDRSGRAAAAAAAGGRRRRRRRQRRAGEAATRPWSGRRAASKQQTTGAGRSPVMPAVAWYGGWAHAPGIFPEDPEMAAGLAPTGPTHAATESEGAWATQSKGTCVRAFACCTVAATASSCCCRRC